MPAETMSSSLPPPRMISSAACWRCAFSIMVTVCRLGLPILAPGRVRLRAILARPIIVRQAGALGSLLHPRRVGLHDGDDRVERGPSPEPSGDVADRVDLLEPARKLAPR